MDSDEKKEDEEDEEKKDEEDEDEIVEESGDAEEKSLQATPEDILSQSFHSGREKYVQPRQHHKPIADSGLVMTL